MIKFKCKKPGEWYDEKEEFLLSKETKKWVIYQNRKNLYWIYETKTLKQAKHIVELLIEKPSLMYADTIIDFWEKYNRGDIL